ncbi:SDR family oxidoreductase [Parafrankia sp. EUN1f]|uniref:SDR family NAD(P)-dependent oxidoreductase n=1 Tax=Parafrankia sp. EUN1f TaxID=102897 RepID=UPI0001C4516D|nr:SDR family NAD(P)-dependent oxidoreductase [Parafrankia sp. EUN1f]EFC84434.1 short-chain dehydrogenase/reductase SDR [Parafrankia sp. EUN1f]
MATTDPAATPATDPAPAATDGTASAANGGKPAGSRTGSRTGRLAGTTALVTGGGSGIGAALCRALAGAGATVICTDLDEAAAARTAGDLPGARSARLDVTDAAAVEQAVADVVARDGRLDLLVNNAGIVFGGETTELTPAQWNQIIDVNIRGVVHGVTAAYPRMIAAGGGHIVNVASLAGLVASGLLTSYVMTKHAVVGLSLALRAEAAAHGVGVTVVCPSSVDTPILDKGAIGSFDSRDLFLKDQGIRKPYDVDRLAADVLAAVTTDRALLIAPRSARMAWRFHRLTPGLLRRSAVRWVANQRSRAAAHAAGR